LNLDILDNEKYIYEQDKKDLIGVLFGLPKQFDEAAKTFDNLRIDLKQGYKNVLILGTGNPATVVFKLIEAVGANRLRVPLYLCSRSTVPSWVSKDTLIIAYSHSGDTIEILDAVDMLTAKGFDIIAVTTGGRLKEKALSHKLIQLIIYDAPDFPRMATGYAYVLMIEILSNAGILTVRGIKKDAPLDSRWEDIKEGLSQLNSRMSPQIKIHDNFAKISAINLYEKIPVIYGCNKITEAVSYRLKVQICTVSKTLGHYNTIPEIDHDEIVAWEMKRELRERFFLIFVRDSDETSGIRQRVEILKGIFIEKKVHFEEIFLEGDNEAVKCFKGICLADWISFYLAILNCVDPSAINLVNDIKKRLETNRELIL
jgi:glucose/mannose-6-phosphate isomerase